MSFGSYDTVEGANCQTVYPERKSRKEAAIEGVRKVGLRQIKAVDEMLFESAPEWKKMFFKRLNILKQYDTGECIK